MTEGAAFGGASKPEEEGDDAKGLLADEWGNQESGVTQEQHNTYYETASNPLLNNQQQQEEISEQIAEKQDFVP